MRNTNARIAVIKTSPGSSTNTSRPTVCYAAEVGAQINGGVTITQDGIEMPQVRVLGSTANMVDIEDKTIVEGRFMTDDESTRIANVAVIGMDVKDKFYANRPAIGEEIKVRGIPLTIIGVEQKRGSFFGDSQDRHIYIPITLAGQMFTRTGGLQLHGKGHNAETFKDAIEEARTLLRNKRQLIGSEEDTFGFVNVDEFNTQMDQITGAIAGVVIPITMIILVVGGIVVMNIMLVSVTERTFEVGLAKSSRSDSQTDIAAVPDRIGPAVRGRRVSWTGTGDRSNPTCRSDTRDDDDHNDWLHNPLSRRLEHYRCAGWTISGLESRSARSDRRADAELGVFSTQRCKGAKTRRWNRLILKRQAIRFALCALAPLRLCVK